jgi:uncharacterized protein (TIGR03066 family)
VVYRLVAAENSMNSRLVVVVAVVMLGLARVAVAGSDNATKLIGAWEYVNPDAFELPKGIALEFTKDGKVKLKLGDKTIKEDYGTYSVKDDIITLKLVLGRRKGKEEFNTGFWKIKKLTDKELRIYDKKEREERQNQDFKRIK